MDIRHEKRIQIVQNMFAKSYNPTEKKIKYPNKSVAEITNVILDHTEKLDAEISKHAPKYPLDKIARIDLCILRLAVYELMINRKEPVKVIINESVELAKELGNQRSYAFVNAVLGSIHTEMANTKEN